MQPLITVGITSYNSRLTVEAAIESALSQNYTPIEVVVVDDASTDGSVELLKELASRRSFRLVLLPSNKGVAHARNVLIAEARGEYLAFFDDDDVSLPARLSKQFESLQQVGSEVLAASYVARTQRFLTGVEIQEAALAHGDRAWVEGAEVIHWALLGRYGSQLTGAAGTGTMMASKHTFKVMQGYDETFRRNEDSDFLVRLAKAGGKIFAVQEPLMIQFLTPGEDKTSKKQLESYFDLMKKHETLLRTEGLWTLAHAWIQLKFSFVNRQYFRLLGYTLLILVTRPGFIWRAVRIAAKRRTIIKARMGFLERGK